MKTRKIAANYIYLPEYPFVKNGYVVLEGERVQEVVDTEGRVREIQGLEFYGGLIVPDYVRTFGQVPEAGELFMPFLEKLLGQYGTDYRGVAILEGADLLEFKWKEGARFRKL